MSEFQNCCPYWVWNSLKRQQEILILFKKLKVLSSGSNRRSVPTSRWVDPSTSTVGPLQWLEPVPPGPGNWPLQCLRTCEVCRPNHVTGDQFLNYITFLFLFLFLPLLLHPLLFLPFLWNMGLTGSTHVVVYWNPEIGLEISVNNGNFLGLMDGQFEDPKWLCDLSIYECISTPMSGATIYVVIATTATWSGGSEVRRRRVDTTDPSVLERIFFIIKW